MHNALEPDSLSIYRLDANWINTKKNKKVYVEEYLLEKYNFYNTSSLEGITNVKCFASILFKDLYEGIDLKYYEKNGNLEYDFILKPFSDYNQIRKKIYGAENIYLGKDGELIIETKYGKIVEQKPKAFQGDKKIDINWEIEGNIIKLKVGDYDLGETLIIDPIVRHWGTYYGGNSDDVIESLDVDSMGNILFCGNTLSSSNIATVGSHLYTYQGGYDAFIGKFNANGNLLWASYFGGTSNQTEDKGQSCSFDNQGNVFLTGYTKSLAGIATQNAHQTSLVSGNNYSSFLAKFDSNGVRLWSTYFHGSGTWVNNNTRAYSCNTDNLGNIYMAGTTQSTSGISTTNAYQQNNAGSGDGFLVKFSSTGNRIWSTYFGGSSSETVYSCETSENDNKVVISGSTNSTNGISSSNAFQTTNAGGTDGLIAVFDSSGNRLWSTYVGGNSFDVLKSVTFDKQSSVIGCGQTSSISNISTVNAHQINFGGGPNGDGFLIKFDSLGSRIWSSYYGGSNDDQITSCFCGSSNNIYLIGITQSTSGISTLNGYQNLFNGSIDGYFAIFDSSGSRYSGTYFGGTDNDIISSGKTDLFGNIYIGGYTASPNNISTQNGHKVSLNPGVANDAFISRFENCEKPPSQSLDTICFGETFISPSGNNLTTQGIYLDTLMSLLGCDSIIQTYLFVRNPPSFSLPYDTIFSCGNSLDTIDAGGGWSSYSWSNGDSLQKIVSNSEGLYSVTISDQFGCDNQDSVYLSILKLEIVTDRNILCLGDSLNLSSYAVPTEINDMIGYWAFEGNTIDSTKLNNLGNNIGAFLDLDRYGNSSNCYKFESGAYIRGVANSLDASVTNKLSISGWINIENFPIPNSSSRIFSHLSANNPNVPQYCLAITGTSQLYFFAGNGDFESNGPNLTSSVLTTNNWHHVAFTYDGDSIKMYVDGNKIFSKHEIDNFSPSLIGNYEFSSSFSNQFTKAFFGRIDDFRVFNRALNKSELKKLFHGKENLNYLWWSGDTSKNLIFKPTQNQKIYLEAANDLGSCHDSLDIAISNPSYSLPFDTIRRCNYQFHLLSAN